MTTKNDRLYKTLDLTLPIQCVCIVMSEKDHLEYLCLAENGDHQSCGTFHLWTWLVVVAI